MPTTKAQARELARTFLDLSRGLTQFRLDNWTKLKAPQHRQIADVAYTLHNYSDDFVTAAVGLALADIDEDLEAIRQGTAKALKVVQTVKTVKGVLSVAAAVVVLGGALASKNPSAIAKAAADLYATGRGLLGGGD